MPLPKLQVTGGATGRGSKVRLDGHEVPGITRFELTMTTTDVNRAVLEINVGSVEIDAETVTELVAAFDPAAGVSKLP